MKSLPSAFFLPQFAFAAFVVFCLTLPAQAQKDGPVAAVQESLQRQQYYSGPVSGTYDDATKAAVRRFQIRRGLKVTGELDAATLEALAAGERALQGQPEDFVPPHETPARERARAMVREDQEFLLDFEEPVFQSVTAAPETRRTAPAPLRASTPPGRPESTATAEVEVKREAVVREPVAEAEPAEPSAPPKPPARAPREREEESVTPQIARVSGAEAQRVVEDYLRAAEGPTPEREVSFYADEVSYFDEGRILRSAVARDQRAYYRRWPERQSTLVGDPEVLWMTNNSATVRFRVRYQLRGSDESARGETENVVQLRRDGERLRIASIRERKVR